MRIKFFLPLLVGIMASVMLVPVCPGQDTGPFLPANHLEAIHNMTRTSYGSPGAQYWQNEADYRIDMQFDPMTRMLAGEEEITYTNNSPDTLNYILLLLLPDMYREGNPTDFYVSPGDRHTGVAISEFKIDAHIIDPSRENSRHVFYNNTSAWVILPEPLLPGMKITMELSWSYRLNAGSHNRTGQVDSSSFFIAYSFPRIGVYDDIDGWNNYDHSGTNEFYNDFGDFDVTLRVPKNHIVWATGLLQNPESTLSGPVLDRYLHACTSPERTAIVRQEDLDGPLTVQQDEVTWHYTALNVTDFAFALSDHYLWDGMTMENGTDGKTLLLSTAYNAESRDFHEVIDMAEKAINYMIHDLPGIPFPYPAMTVFNGLDYMEYPMMVNDDSYAHLGESFKVTAHEILHSYFPFMTGCNERKYAWMDEGLTSFFDVNMMRDLAVEGMDYPYFIDEYVDLQGTERDIPLITISELIRQPEYFGLSYAKAVSFYTVLMDELGREEFREVIREFADQWKGKHPTGYDLLNTFEHKTGQDLWWLIEPWFFETGSCDLAISDARISDTGYAIDIKRIGNLPTSVRLSITYKDGSQEVITEKPSVWSNEKDVYTLSIPSGKPIKQLELLPIIPMDSNRQNDTWTF